jgi:adenine/guanine/hypoxanthine permease
VSSPLPAPAVSWRTEILLALFFSPLFAMLGGGILDAETGRVLYPVTAPALVIVGSLMAGNMRKVEWSEPAEAFPAFLAMIMMPLTYSIADGLAIGFIAASLIDLVRSNGRRLPVWVHVGSALFALRYVFLHSA